MKPQLDVAATVDEIVQRVRALPARSTTHLRSVRREFSRRLRQVPPDEIVALAAALIRTPEVHRFIADELIVYHPTALSSLSEDDVVRLAGELNSWDRVDCFSLYLAGRAWRLGRVRDETVAAWARSPNRWWRRTALVSTVALNARAQGGTGDTQRTLMVCDLLLRDRDAMVEKAMSWALRVLTVHDRAAVKDYLAAHRAEMASRVVREVENKLRTGLKNPRPRSERRA